jgi:hypothetical protein
LNNSAKKVFLTGSFENDEIVFGKKVALNAHNFNHLSPEHEKISLNSPKSKYILNKTAGKNLWGQSSEDSKREMKGSQFLDEQNTSKPHHYYAYKVNYCESEAETNVDSTVVSVYSPAKKMLSSGRENESKGVSVEECFGQVLCRDYGESKGTKEEFISINIILVSGFMIFGNYLLTFCGSDENKSCK